MAEAPYPVGMADRSAGTRLPLRPVVTNDRATVAVGCAVWAVLLVLCLAFSERLEAEGRHWWVWTCVGGLTLGLAGLAFLQHRATRPPSGS